jgi:pyrroloquinoline quinone (PQQ) biosynthesis protein C
VFHSIDNQFAPKSTHFFYAAMHNTQCCSFQMSNWLRQYQQLLFFLVCFSFYRWYGLNNLTSMHSR